MDRLTKLVRNLPCDIDAALITHPTNRQYYTGFHSSAGTVLVTRDACYFIIDSRYFESAKSTVKSCTVILQDKTLEQITELAAKHKVKNLAIESATVNMQEFQRLKSGLSSCVLLSDDRLSLAIAAQCAVKSQDELDLIQRAQDITDRAFTHILDFIKEGKTEREIALELEFYTRKSGSEEAAFSFIVVSGKNTSLPHGVPSDKLVQAGDFITMDFGCTVEGYRSDMTRTIAVGQPSDKQRRLYNTVLQAQLKALAAIKTGMGCKAVDAVARELIETAENALYKGCFGHGLGHSLGLDVHENPRFSPTDETVLQTGMVMSVEPGIYLPGEFGVRIEDIVAVNKTGCHNFTASKKDLIQL